ncbi:solute carrier organic anion transporter family member 4A1-like [Diadema antillarum]|uniref:solute carrier organic anion transporter family member 4A1-like n=1 Tax=Diadema antillarum TaxID=105358 RepID=UPI003A8ACA83
MADDTNGEPLADEFQPLLHDQEKLLLTSSSKSTTTKDQVDDANGDTEERGERRYGWFSFRPSCLQFWNNPKGVLFWLCGLAVIQSYVTSGLVFTDTTTLEQRFGLPSVQSGFLASCYDLALLVVILFVTYFGERGNKPLWLGNGALIFALGSLTFALPQFIAGLYQPSTLIPDVCDLESNYTDTCSADSTSSDSYYWVFVLAQCLHGIGAAPIYTLGVTYLDESVAPSESSIYLGIIQTCSIIGPALGYLLGAYFLSIYVDPGVNPESLGLTPDSPLWVGAWWIGFLTSASLALIVAIPLLGFPKYLPDAKNIDGHLDRDQCQKGSNFEAHADDLAGTTRDIPRATRILVTNAPFMLLNCSAACEWFIISCLAAFGPKFFESQFGISSSAAAFETGVIVIPSSCVGTLVGAVIVLFFKLKFRGMIKFCLGCLVISLACMPIFVLSCPDPDMAGATVQYVNTSLPYLGGEANLTTECNKNCHCLTDFNPVCGSNDVMYYSTCYAGCQAEAPGSNGSDRMYFDCSCIPGNETGEHGHALLGKCPVEPCSIQAPFLVVMSLVLTFTFLGLVPSILATMRCVAHSQRSFALGIQSLIYRGLGTVPGPIVFGALIDLVCIVWQTDCDGSQTCWLYQNADFSLVVLSVTMILRVVSITFICLALLFYKPAEPGDDKENVTNDTLCTSHTTMDTEFSTSVLEPSY